MHPEPQALHALLPARALDALYEESARGLDAIGHLSWDETGALHATPAALQILGLRASDTPSVRGLLAMVRRSRQAALMTAWTDAVGMRQRRIEMELPCVLASGVLRHVRTIAVVEYTPLGKVRQVVAALQDVTLAQALSTALTAAEGRLEEAQQMADFGSWEWDFQRNRAIYSAEALRITGMSHGATVSSGLDQAAALIPAEQRDAVIEMFKRAVRDRLPTVRYDYHVADAAGQRRELHGRAKLVYDGGGKLRRMLGTIQDVTELRDYRRQVHSLAFFDPVTALPNRSWLVERLHQALSQGAQGHSAEFGMLMLGLDQFKKVNDSLGHSAGDELLKLVGARLSNSMRETDVVARLTGDTFAILAPEVRQADALARVASKLLQALSAPFDLNGTDVFVTASIGAALYPSDGNSAEALLQHADAALSHAKGRGRNNVQFYSPQLTAQASHRLMLESELRRGVERQELLLHYQPKFDLMTQKLVGAEALMRWCQPQRGMVSPMSFIPLAEETGLIVRMGTWALHEACHAVSSWNRERSNDPLKIAVNLSARQFAEGHNIVEAVQGALAASACEPRWLELEITESLLLDGSEGVRQSLEALAAMGITIAIDDFGTGYSALGYLTRLPVQTLKIDRSFVSELPHNGKSAELVKAIVSVGRSLNMALVAEGVETVEQAEYLKNAGCHLAQGYLFGRPLEMAAFDKLLSS
ncbi:bifunctional diguanylate cyclase/phosphodiesterase [Piscinibacter sp. HJYY11]|uniref:putative bifunctional diguanylate cyclase/phosphodiesterase n=1 Tax=Piscinibacter sp. HJYY11 TaxID=2801333 RepID=UPI00191DFCE7|nr:bifunctional diguanylate cyclase/phosphodiesterase [Piscinibacter sp. HJYY11]MBL0729237.1 EAL domain-containing protein [Piscinibacter sp. HJYY11]